MQILFDVDNINNRFDTYFDRHSCLYHKVQNEELFNICNCRETEDNDDDNDVDAMRLAYKKLFDKNYRKSNEHFLKFFEYLNKHLKAIGAFAKLVESTAQDIETFVRRYKNNNQKGCLLYDVIKK